jgi:two-component system OmpR family response regulator
MRRSVNRGRREIELLPTEFRLLYYMMQHPGEVLTRTMLLEKVWNFSFDPTTNVVDVHVSRLRRKPRAAGEAPMIRAIRGTGAVPRGHGQELHLARTPGAACCPAQAGQHPH